MLFKTSPIKIAQKKISKNIFDMPSVVFRIVLRTFCTFTTSAASPIDFFTQTLGSNQILYPKLHFELFGML